MNFNKIYSRSVGSLHAEITSVLMGNSEPRPRNEDMGKNFTPENCLCEETKQKKKIFFPSGSSLPMG